MKIVNLSAKCDYCGRKIPGEPLRRYFRAFCTKEHVASYFGDYVEEVWDEVYWTDFY